MTRTDWTLIWPPLRSIFGEVWRGQRLLIAFVLVLVAGGSLLTIGVPYVFSRLIDLLAAGNLAAGLVVAFLLYALLRGLETLLSYVSQFASFVVAENLHFIAATAFFAKLLEKPGGFFIEHNPVEIQTARAQGEGAVQMIAQLGLIVFAPGVIQIVSAIVLLGAVISLEIVFIVFVYGVVFVVATYLANRWTRPLLDQAIEAMQANAQFVGNAVNAMETLRYFNGERWISETFTQKAEVTRSAWAGWAKRRAVMSVFFGVALAVQLGITFVLLLPRFDAGEMSVGDIVLINLVLVALNQPFEMIGMAIDDVFRATSRFLPFARMWAAPRDATMAGDNRPIAPAQTVSFDGATFVYGGRSSFAPASFTARRGQITFITGPTGSGKSTLFKLALKSLEPSEGRILVDGIDLADISRHAWYETVGVVPQDVMLLNDTLGANIVLGRDRDEARLRQAAARADILAFIEGLPDKFETTVGERGLKLSGGERQRVSIARALYGDPAVLFLDEASSALDEGTERAIMDEVRGLADQMIVIAITHRKSVIEPHDQVIVLAAPEGPAR